MENNNNEVNEVLSGNKITSFATAIEYAAKRLGEIKLITIAKATLILTIIVLTVLGINIAINRSATEQLLSQVLKIQSDEKEDLSIRDMVTPKIQKRLTSLVYTLNCDRAFVIELHNGKKNATELPFKYFDMTYEEVNDKRHIKHVSQHFLNIMVTHYKIPYFLAKENFFYGDVEELEKVDRRFAANFEEHRGAHIAMITLRVNGEEIGFLGVSYEETERVPSKETIKKVLSDEADAIKDFLDLSAQKGKK